MKTKIITMIVVLLMCCFYITGCSNNPQMDEVDGADIGNSYYGTYEWISPDGVHYWVYSGVGRYAIAPRYDSNGELVID